jgi:hypothetical protein
MGSIRSVKSEVRSVKENLVNLENPVNHGRFTILISKDRGFKELLKIADVIIDSLKPGRIFEWFPAVTDIPI